MKRAILFFLCIAFAISILPAQGYMPYKGEDEYTPEDSTVILFPQQGIYEVLLGWIEENFGEGKKTLTVSDALAAAKRASGLGTLRTILTYEMMYYVEMGEFEPDIRKLDLPESKYYDISIKTDHDKLEIRAEANIDQDDYMDIIIMDERGEIHIVEDDLKNKRDSYVLPVQGSGYKSY